MPPAVGRSAHDASFGVAAAGGGGAGARLPTGQADAVSEGFFY